MSSTFWLFYIVVAGLLFFIASLLLHLLISSISLVITVTSSANIEAIRRARSDELDEGDDLSGW